VDNWWVYIIEKRKNLYVGITTDLTNRMRQHGQSTPLYREGPMPRTNAALREKTLKRWSRKKKLELMGKASSQDR
jgi:predicted GIY-YIG superfamily endonuclease